MTDAQFVVLVVCLGYWAWVAAVSIADRRRRRVDLAEYRWPIDGDECPSCGWPYRAVEGRACFDRWHAEQLVPKGAPR